MKAKSLSQLYLKGFKLSSQKYLHSKIFLSCFSNLGCFIKKSFFGCVIASALSGCFDDNQDPQSSSSSDDTYVNDEVSNNPVICVNSAFIPEPEYLNYPYYNDFEVSNDPDTTPTIKHEAWQLNGNWTIQQGESYSGLWHLNFHKFGRGLGSPISGYAELDKTIEIPSAAANPRLQFRHKLQLAKDNHFVTVEASIVDETSTQESDDKTSANNHVGSNKANNKVNKEDDRENWSYIKSFSKNNNTDSYVHVDLDLTKYKGQKIRIRFRVAERNENAEDPFEENKGNDAARSDDINMGVSKDENMYKGNEQDHSSSSDSDQDHGSSNEQNHGSGNDQVHGNSNDQDHVSGNEQGHGSDQDHDSGNEQGHGSDQDHDSDDEQGHGSDQDHDSDDDQDHGSGSGNDQDHDNRDSNVEVFWLIDDVVISDADSDNDGVSDVFEQRVGTDPFDSNDTPLDGDADGIPDVINQMMGGWHGECQYLGGGEYQRESLYVSSQVLRNQVENSALEDCSLSWYTVHNDYSYSLKFIDNITTSGSNIDLKLLNSHIFSTELAVVEMLNTICGMQDITSSERKVMSGVTCGESIKFPEAGIIHYDLIGNLNGVITLGDYRDQTVSESRANKLSDERLFERTEQ